MADPGFSVGGAPTRWGGANLRRVHFLAKTYAKTKEIDPVGGGAAPAAPPPPDPPMVNQPNFQSHFLHLKHEFQHLQKHFCYLDEYFPLDYQHKYQLRAFLHH